MDAFETYFAGGYEIGGVLFGDRSGSRVRVLAYRGLDINPPRPSFVLSKKDERNLKRLLDSCKADPELAGMEPVGWYHSHTRSEVFLSESDIEIYDAWFPEPWQIALVFRPTEGEPVRAGFFFRESDGFIRADQSYQEISFDPPQRRKRSRQRPPWEISADGSPVESAAMAAAEAEPPVAELALEPSSSPPPAPRAPEKKPSSKKAAAELVSGVVWRYLRWMAITAVVLAAMAVGVPYLIDAFDPDPPMGLDVMLREGDLQIRWNPKTVMDSDTATLFIVDGSRRLDRPLNKTQLGKGLEIYRPSSARVDVRLQLSRTWGRTRQEIATYLAHPDRGKPSPELIAARQELSDAETELNRLRSELLGQWQLNEKLDGRILELNQRREQLSAIREDTRRKAAAAAQSKQPSRDLPTAPEVAPRPTIAAAQIPQQAEILRPPAEPPKPQPQAQAPAQPEYRPVPPPAAATTPGTAPTPAPAAPKPQAPTGPTSGRFLWTGDLPRNGVLTIDGRKASNGIVTGELPSGNVRIGAYPAELAGDVMKVFTANPRFGSQPRMDAPSAGNGWNKTLYTYDQRALRDLIVEQLPSSAAPRRLVLRAGARNVSVILIEWQLVTP